MGVPLTNWLCCSVLFPRTIKQGFVFWRYKFIAFGQVQILCAYFGQLSPKPLVVLTHGLKEIAKLDSIFGTTRVNQHLVS